MFLRGFRPTPHFYGLTFSKGRGPTRPPAAGSQAKARVGRASHVDINHHLLLLYFRHRLLHDYESITCFCRTVENTKAISGTNVLPPSFPHAPSDKK